MDEGTIVWDGYSGRSYTYWIYRIGTTFNAAPGNYIFAKEIRPRVFAAVYVGETSDLSERFDNHHKMPCIRLNGATHIHVHRNDGGVEARRAEEKDIRWRYDPPCNG